MKKAALAVVLGSFLLAGCFPAILVSGGVAAGTMLATDSRSLQTIADDTNIQHQASQKLKADPAFADGSDIVVTSFNYVVLITGQVPSDQLRQKAEQIVQTVPKIKRVYNMLQVAPAIGLLQDMDDGTISANIKARMGVTSDLNSNNFKYVVNNKVVYLMGYASKAQTKLALQVIANSSGVKKVVNLVQYSDDASAEPATPPMTTTAAPAAATPAPVTTPAVETPSAPTASADASASQPAAPTEGAPVFVPTTTT